MFHAIKTRPIKFFRSTPQTDQAIRLTHRLIYILPTQRGMGFIVLIAILGLIAFVYNNNLVYLLTFILTGVFLTTILQTFRSLSNLTVQISHIPTVFAHDAATFEVLIQNPSVYERVQLHLHLEQTEHFSIQARSQTQVLVYSKTHRRGWHKLKTITLYSTFPIGLFKAWSRLNFSHKALVFPCPSPIDINHPENHSPPGDSSHQTQNIRTQGQDDFYGLKSYQQGDSLNQIHWKTLAKGYGVFTKQYGSETSQDLWFNFSQTPGQNTEERLSHLCRWIIDAENAGLRYGLILPNKTIKLNHGHQHHYNCLKELALF